MTMSCDTLKCRELVFHPTPPGQAERALDLLVCLPRMTVAHIGPRTLRIAYCMLDYSLEDIENELQVQGFHLEATLLIRLKRNLAYYCERVQRENMGKPEPRTKNYKAHVESWHKRPHGDHDETPSEWRQYR